MTENAGIDPRVAAAEQSVRDATGAPDPTQVAEDPTGETGAWGGVADDDLAEPEVGG